MAKRIDLNAGNIVEEFKIGGTYIRICDDSCCNTTPEQVQQILRRVARDALPHLQAAMQDRIESA